MGDQVDTSTDYFASFKDNQVIEYVVFQAKDNRWVILRDFPGAQYKWQTFHPAMYSQHPHPPLEKDDWTEGGYFNFRYTPCYPRTGETVALKDSTRYNGTGEDVCVKIIKYDERNREYHALNLADNTKIKVRPQNLEKLPTDTDFSKIDKLKTRLTELGECSGWYQKVNKCDVPVLEADESYIGKNAFRRERDSMLVFFTKKAMYVTPVAWWVIAKPDAGGMLQSVWKSRGEQGTGDGSMKEDGPFDFLKYNHLIIRPESWIKPGEKDLRTRDDFLFAQDPALLAMLEKSR